MDLRSTDWDSATEAALRSPELFSRIVGVAMTKSRLSANNHISSLLLHATSLCAKQAQAWACWAQPARNPFPKVRAPCRLQKKTLLQHYFSDMPARPDTWRKAQEHLTMTYSSGEQAQSLPGACIRRYFTASSAKTVMQNEPIIGGSRVFVDMKCSSRVRQSRGVFGHSPVLAS